MALDVASFTQGARTDRIRDVTHLSQTPHGSLKTNLT
jgi:hypothetical protein